MERNLRVRTVRNDRLALRCSLGKRITRTQQRDSFIHYANAGEWAGIYMVGPEIPRVPLCDIDRFTSRNWTLLDRVKEGPPLITATEPV